MADYIVWVDTISAGRFEDTNQIFVKPEKFLIFMSPLKMLKYGLLKLLKI